MACTPRLPAEAGGRWRTRAPREPIPRTARAVLGLRNDSGGASLTVTVTVRAPGGEESTRETTLKPRTWAEVTYPADFRRGRGGHAPARLARGTHTVLWHASGGRLISCDGFVVK
ncbi:hypothetical protein D5H75_28130 [Bailinhaonella thermotolerans]|uniref:Uncharacterized protein n=1 Tax=Bailinhaonella thermotolerans TaxID=1070861 RepID=A0A3A4A834_9ACTN|nr:hypothetical protein D5H75_28130 [Bailinhaonella thermotolerans]